MGGRLARLAITTAVVCAVRVLLTTSSVGRVQRWVLRAGAARWLPRTEPPAVVAARVSRTARLVPCASCLTQALSTQLLLAWHGEDATVHYGARRDGDGFTAHAWVEIDGRSIDPSSDSFRRLRPVGAARD